MVSSPTMTPSAWPELLKGSGRAPSVTTTASSGNRSSRDSSPDAPGSLGVGSPTKEVPSLRAYACVAPASRGRSQSILEAAENFGEVTVRNTFIHFDLDDEEEDPPRPLRRCASAPGLLRSEAVSAPSADAAKAASAMVVASDQMIWEHKHGECRPCAYFLFKPDGCRHGPDCEFCHLCTVNDIKRRKKERSKQGKSRWTGARSLRDGASKWHSR